MRKWPFFLLAGVLAALGATTILKKPPTESKAPAAQAEQDSYWTCPMHPQIHQDHPGECPICHMKLVKVTKKAEAKASAQGEPRVAITASESQLTLAGVQKYEVQTMTLRPVIPVSGRILSSAQVAFQVYERDLRYVRPGLAFTGTGNIYSEEISGVIASVDAFVDPTSRTVRVVGAIRRGPEHLLPETSFRGEIALTLDQRVVIPESSVLHTGHGDLVYVVDAENRLTAKHVSLGLKSEGYYEVLRGLEPGDVISSGPNFLIDSEAKIRGANGQAHH